ncbi:Fe2OG dioxygenase domain-containing protein [Haematococcus lacustris]|uniref:Fe2OG dioxygenase domain-containing protein n=1 Tax=Haematococcus lacustris TaxID=44745 RepID=A0A6A0A6H3_HAELA|nr:Fe2OG dioxygenase domain-containing protein [Haematococcus lacustris]
MARLGHGQVLLEGGDLLLLHGPARYHWRHGIDAVPQEVERATGRNVVRSLRVSVTLRKLSGILLTEPAD